MVMVQ